MTPPLLHFPNLISRFLPVFLPVSSTHSTHTQQLSQPFSFLNPFFLFQFESCWGGSAGRSTSLGTSPKLISSLTLLLRLPHNAHTPSVLLSQPPFSHAHLHNNPLLHPQPNIQTTNNHHSCSFYPYHSYFLSGLPSFGYFACPVPLFPPNLLTPPISRLPETVLTIFFLFSSSFFIVLFDFSLFPSIPTTLFPSPPAAECRSCSTTNSIALST